MAIVRFGDQKFLGNPWADIERMRRELDSLFYGAGQGALERSGAAVFPALNISEDDDNLYVRAEIPGVPSDAIDLAIKGDILTICGERNTCPSDEERSYHRREIECGRFNRAISLPVKIDGERVSARAADGILTITLPKAQEAKPRQIKVALD